MSSDFNDDDDDKKNVATAGENAGGEPGEQFNDDFESGEEDYSYSSSYSVSEDKNEEKEENDDEDNPMLGLLKKSKEQFDENDNNNPLQDKLNELNKEEDDDDDDGGQITLGARQPSFSNLKTLIPKGSTNPVDLDDLQEDGEKNDDDSNEGQITLSVRQPSYSNLHGNMILKGSTKALPNVADIIAEEDAKPQYVEVKAEENEDEDKFAEEPVNEDDDDDDDNQAITLSVRQPSFQNLHGQLIPKGSTHAIPQEGNPDPVIVEELPKESQIKLDAKEAPFTGEILKSLHKFNQERWKQLGYNPEITKQRRMSQIALDPAITWNLDFRNASCANYYPKINEVTIENDPNGRKKRPLSSRKSNSDLSVEMPDNYSTQVNVASSSSNDEDKFDEEMNTEESEELPRLINSAGGRRNSSQIFDILPDSLIQEKKSKKSKNNVTPKSGHKKPLKAPQKTYKNAPPKSNSTGSSPKKSKAQKIEGLDVDFHLYLDDIRVSQGYDSEQGSSRIPERLRELIVHPKESVTYLALCGISILGYKEATVSRVYNDLKKYLEQCVSLGYIEESMYVDGIMKKIKNEKNELEKTQASEEVESLDNKIEEINKQLEKMSKEHQRNLESIDAEKQLAVEEINIKTEAQLEKVDEEWNSDKMQTKFNKPSPKLIEMRQMAQRLLTAQRFEEGAAMAEMIQKQEEMESEQAAEKMNAAYQAAVDRVMKKSAADVTTVEGMFNDKKTNAEGQYKKSLLPLQNKLQSLQYEKENKKMEIKKNERELKAAMVARRPESRNSTMKMSGGPISITKRLSLPPLKHVIRPMTSFKRK